MESLSQATIATLYDSIRKEVSKTDREDAICNALNAQRRDGQYCDFTIKCNGKVFYSHKCVLAVTSDFFNALFTSPLSTDDTHSSTVNFDKFSTETVSLFLNIVYGEVDVQSTHDVVELLRIAEYVQYSWLVELLVKAIRITIDNSNVFAWQEISEKCSVAKLQMLTESLIRKKYGFMNSRSSKSNIKYEVIFSIVNEKKEIYTIDIDVDKSLCDNYSGEMVQLYNNRNATPEDGVADKVKILLLFMHKNELFVVTETEEFNCSSFQYEGKSLALYRYEQLTQTYNTVFSKTIEDLYLKFSIGKMVFQDVAYDNADSVYFLLSDAESSVEEEEEEWSILLKYDISFDNFCDAYVRLCDDSYQDFFILRKNVGQLVILDVTCIYYIENFATNHQTPRKITINSNSIYQKCVPTTSWFKVVDLDGSVYSFVKFGKNMWDRRNLVFHVLKLNADELVWDHVCDVNYYTIFNCFSFQSKIYIYGLQDSDNTPNRDTQAKFSKLCEFDPEEKILVDCELTLECGGFPDYFFKVPSYILA